MADDNHVFRVHQLDSEIAEQNAIIREIIERSVRILREPMPDTFLGRRTYEPFPDEEKEQGRSSPCQIAAVISAAGPSRTFS